MNYSIEHEHDSLLIQLVNDLCEIDRLDVVENTFDVTIQGKSCVAIRRRPFDVELTFENLSIIIETKVDSDEAGRWPDQEWQTDTIVRNCDNLHYLKKDKHYRFITYGTSEFYTKDCKAGSASSEFQHIGLDRIVALINESEKLLSPRMERTNWLNQMYIEQEKRKNASKLLQSYSRFRKEYIEIHKENDFPRNRYLFCAPELAFPVMFSLLEEWRKSNYANEFGMLELYPVGRRSPLVHDSVLSFYKMLHGEGNFYLEINEDFNLNVKLKSEVNEFSKTKIWSSLNDADWPSFTNHQCRDYEQGAFVVYEVDFGFLDNLNDMKQVTTNLGQTVESIVGAFPTLELGYT